MNDPRLSGDRSSFLGLAETAELVGVHRHVERKLFLLTGRWSLQAAADPDPAGVAGFFATQSAIHAWRLGEWEQRSPRSVEVSVEADCSGWDEAFAAADSVDSVAAKLACWVHVLTVHLADRYGAHLRGCVPAADSGTARWLEIARRDVLDGLAQGASVLAQHGHDDHAAVAEVVAACLVPLLESGS